MAVKKQAKDANGNPLPISVCDDSPTEWFAFAKPEVGNVIQGTVASVYARYNQDAPDNIEDLTPAEQAKHKFLTLVIDTDGSEEWEMGVTGPPDAVAGQLYGERFVQFSCSLAVADRLVGHYKPMPGEKLIITRTDDLPKTSKQKSKGWSATQNFTFEMPDKDIGPPPPMGGDPYAKFDKPEVQNSGNAFLAAVQVASDDDDDDGEVSTSVADPGSGNKTLFTKA